MMHSPWMKYMQVAVFLTINCLHLLPVYNLATDPFHEEAFSVIWHVPTSRCLDLGVDIDFTKFGILVNPDQSGWRGPIVTIFYADEMGLYPYVADNGSLIYGGIPQLGNLTAHLKKSAEDIAWAIPDQSYDGLAVIDWEGWRPIWTRNFDSKLIYQKLSIQLVQQQHPTWNHSEVEHEAIKQFEKAARTWMEETLFLGYKLRPSAKWGFYHFPDCYNHHSSVCTDQVKAENDRLMWLFDQSGALYPSYYLYKSMDPSERSQLVVGQIHEAFRIVRQATFNTTPVFPYSRITYEDGGVESFYSMDDLNNTIMQASYFGTNGVLLWGDHLLTKDRPACEELKRYVYSQLGPLAVNATISAQTCSKTHCSGHGRCSRYTPINKLLHLNKSRDNSILKSRLENYDRDVFHMDHSDRLTHSSPLHEVNMSSGIDCQCYQGWSGRDCSHQQ